MRSVLSDMARVSITRLAAQSIEDRVVFRSPPTSPAIISELGAGGSNARVRSKLIEYQRGSVKIRLDYKVLPVRLIVNLGQELEYYQGYKFPNSSSAFNGKSARHCASYT
jgi:hypothetical protein